MTGDQSRVATIYDIARVAQVSPSTVSRALSTPGRLNAKTEARIRQVAKDLKYQLNPMARALPTGRSHMLGVLVSDITNPVFFDMVRGADRSAQAAGNTMVLSESQEQSEREGQAARRMLGVVDGLILSSSRQSDQQIQELATVKPLVVVNRVVSEVLSIVPDLTPGIDEAVTRVKAAGHRAITYLSGPQGSWMNTARQEALARATKQHGITITTVQGDDPTIAGGAAHLDQVLPMPTGTQPEPGPTTVVFAFNDLMAIGLMQAAAAAGVQVPQDLSVIGFDDIFGADLTSPPLSSIRAPLGELGERAVEELLSLVSRNNEPLQPQELTYGATTFVARGSASL